ncbi:MAG: hypothetical protein JXB36_21005 [Gammaproteobacteria bacterium]|nr:hypothetical protein [Gammaproteobacteria bacterium]
MVDVYTLTPAAAAQAFQDSGLDALGLTTVRLSPTWGSATPSFDAATLRLTPSGNARAPYRGILEYLDDGAEFRDVTGAPITGPVAAYRLHPQAVARLESLFSARYAPAGQPHHRLVPETLVFAGAVPAPDRSPQTYEPGETLPRTEPMSFHDNRGLVIDPIAVAALFADLIAAFPALDFTDGGTGTAGAGGVATIAGLASGVLAHVTDLHGRAFAAVAGGPGVEKRDAGDSAAGAPDGSGLVPLAAGETLAGTGTNAATRLRIGWATGGVMGAGPLAQPALPGGVTLPRQFFRAFAVDLDWHLRGNRTTSEVRGIPAEDGDMPADLKPQVRDDVTVDYPVDGPDLLAHASQVLDRLFGATGSNLLFAVSPVIDAGVALPPAPGAAAHWPAFPAPDTGAGFAAGTPSPVAGATATWTADNDVVLELPADTVPDGAAVRVYSQSFRLIESIGEAPSFLRGDGGAAIASAGSPTRILVRNPLNLAPGDPKPSPATLVFDLVVTPRSGSRRLYGARSLAIDTGPAAAPADPFAGADPMAAVPDSVKSIAPAPLFGMTRTTSPAGGLSDPIEIVRALGSETEPRQGPRHATMGRHETIVVTGLEDAGALDDGLMWDGLLTGARWSRETPSAAHRDGNPGNPAGPDTHSGGVRVNGALGYDLARHAVRRVQPILPLPGGPSTSTSPGWIVMSGGDNMNPPEPGDTPPPGGTSSGVLLETVAAVAETPELSLLPDTTPLASDTPVTLDQLIDAIAAALGIPSPSGSITIGNEDRLINEVRREYFLSKHGARDALWSLARAVGEAEELVYIETAGFARTARPGGSPAAHEIDLVERLAARLASQPNLKVVICTPRETDFAPAPFARRAMAQRKEAYDMLNAAGPGRVVAFHPRGFPGRFVALRSTTVIVDDVWSLTGATHFRRRGMTFDGSAAIASFDRDIADGYSRKVRAQRQLLMAAKLGIAPTDADGLPVPDFLRLQRPAAAFDLIADLLRQGGLGKVAPLWHGPTDTSVLPQSDDVADPDGSNGAPGALTLASFLSEA